MNILLITTHLNFGGITSYTVSLAKGLKDKGDNVIVASSGGDFQDYLNRIGIEHINIPIRTKSELSPKVMLSAIKLKKIMRHKNIQIIHAQNRVSQILACGLARISHIPFISTYHGFFKPRLTRKVFACYGKKAIAISKQVRRHLIEDLKIRPQDTVVIYNGIDIDRFNVQDKDSSAQIKKELNLGNGPVIGILARLSDVKGHKFLILAIKEVLRQKPDVQLLIIGDGRERYPLEALVAQLGIGGHVRFIPSVVETEKFLSMMDIFCMPSLQEGLGLSIMEAQACGLAVVASDIGGITSLIKHNETGILVNPQDVHALAKAILYLINNPSARKQMGQNAQRFIIENFSLKKMTEETRGVYVSVLQE